MLMGCSAEELAIERTMITTRDSFDEQLTDNERQQFWALVRDAPVFEAELATGRRISTRA